MQPEKVFCRFQITFTNSLPRISEPRGQKHPIFVSNSDSFHSFQTSRAHPDFGWPVLAPSLRPPLLSGPRAALDRTSSVARRGDEGTEGNSAPSPGQIKLPEKGNSGERCNGQRGENQDFLSDPPHGKPALPTGRSGMKTLYTYFSRGNAHSILPHAAGRCARPTPRHAKSP